MQSFKNLAGAFDGVVTGRHVELGQLINSGGSSQPLFEVSDLHRVASTSVRIVLGRTEARPESDVRNAAISGRAVRRNALAYSRAMNPTSHSTGRLQADNTRASSSPAVTQLHFEIPTEASGENSINRG